MQLTVQRKVSTENLNLGSPAKKWHSEVTLISQIMQKNGSFQTFSAGWVLVAGWPRHRAHHLSSSGWPFECHSVLTMKHPSLPGGVFHWSSIFSNVVFQVYINTKVPRFICELVMSSGARDSLNLGFPHSFCFASVCCIISATTG